jgi:hypothetical protein
MAGEHQPEAIMPGYDLSRKRTKLKLSIDEWMEAPLAMKISREGAHTVNPYPHMNRVSAVRVMHGGVNGEGILEAG